MKDCTNVLFVFDIACFCSIINVERVIILKKEFMAVILGCDENTYGFARYLHENYGIVPIALTTTLLEVCKNSQIIDITVDEKLHDYEHFIETLVELGKKLKKEYEKIFIVPCSDFYMEICSKGRDSLKDYENIFISYEKLKEFNDKISFYNMCERYDLPYPKTIIVTPENYKEKLKTVDFDYPVILKPNNSNSIEYLNASFEEKEKVYFVNSIEELTHKIEAVYDSSYQKELLIQKFVQGDDTNMRVLNVYSDRKGKVKVISLNQPILEEYHPATFGNYAAIISLEGMVPIMDKIKTFLEDVGFTGAANFDIKIDEVSKEYYLFEINPRPGRSSYVTTVGGASIQEAFVEDLVKNDLKEHFGNTREALWLNVPFLLVKKYVKNTQILEKVKSLKSQKKVIHTLKYNKDNSLKRKFVVYLQYARKIHYYPKYFIEKK